jgi:ATP/maltotriose-dependent transcriptional regulator MalT
MDPADADPLEAVRRLLEAQEWDAALDAVRAASVRAELEAEQADLEAEALWWLGRLDDCIAARERAYRAFHDAGDQQRAGRCAVWLWEHHAMRIRPSVAGGWLRRARRALEGDETTVDYGRLLLREAEAAHGAGRIDDAIALSGRAADLGRSLQVPDLEAEALQARGRVLIERGDLAEGMGHLDEAMLLAVEGRLGPYATGKVYCSLISACEEVGDFDRAAEWTEATMGWSQRHPFAVFPGICRVHRAALLKRRGSLAEAEREAERACDELVDSHLANSAAAYAEVGDIRRRLGQLDRAEEAFARAEELQGGPCAALALLRLAQGRTEAARTIVDTSLRSTTHPLARAGLLPTVVHVAVAAQDLDAAGTALEELEEITARLGTPELLAVAASTRGRLELARRDPAAVATLQVAVDRWRALDVPYEVATARTLLGQALRDAGEDEAATASFAAGAALFDHIGARLDADRHARDATAPLPAGLTAREGEVLRLIAGGLTNNEIAAELHLSAKTVSRHLSNIFTKIGVTSRASATAFAFEHDLVDRSH